MAEVSMPKKYYIILKTDDEVTKTSAASGRTGLVIKRNAMAGGIWLLDRHHQEQAEDKDNIVLTSTADNADYVETSRTNVTHIPEIEYRFLVAVQPKRRLTLLGSAKLQDLLNVKIYDKVSVSLILNGQEQTKDSIVHYIGPVESRRGNFFGVVFENDVGDTDGSIGDKIYFVAKKNHGKFVSVDKIQSISKSKISLSSKRSKSSSSLEETASTTPSPVSPSASATKAKTSGPEIRLRKRSKSQSQLLSLAIRPSEEEPPSKNDTSRSPQKIVRDDNTAEKSALQLSVDSRVVFFEESGFPLHGTIRFIGCVTKFSGVTHVGVELDKRITEGEGNYKDGKKIFDCPRNRGLLARPEELIKEEDFKLMIKEKEKEKMGKIVVDQPFDSHDHDVDENNNSKERQPVSMTTEESAKSKRKERTKSSVGEEHFSCPICLDTVEEAIETNCCHQIFCERCIRKHRETSCPKCRKQPFTITVSHFVRKLVGNFCVECSNEGCVEILTRSNLKYHREKCTFELIRCPNEGCKPRIRRDNLEEHLRNCGHALITCRNKGCLTRVARKDMNEHHKICDQAEIECSNNGCHVKLIRLKLSQHQRETCRYMSVMCPTPGCRFKGPGTKLGEHIGQEHYELFIKHLGGLKDLYASDPEAGIYTVQWNAPPK